LARDGEDHELVERALEQFKKSYLVEPSLLENIGSRLFIPLHVIFAIEVF
jgi:hypothetical protein